MDIYKFRLPTLGGYLTENGQVNLKRTAIILKDLGGIEDEVLRERKQQEEHQRRREKQRDDERKKEEEEYKKRGVQSMGGGPTYKMACKLATWKLSQPLGEKDEVRLGEEGWKKRYYWAKMHLDMEKEEDSKV
eukprot:TRINITY_DN3032_c0_g1_i1.p1 TRINITY_DN3032_c0_g1~~TRINITY_DN3032_c0_g1_i1.p1  ORF type:complete len:145 (+),score=27.67 TRINITY_DN3032_c0_g1_i1:39-437(+)